MSWNLRKKLSVAFTFLGAATAASLCVPRLAFPTAEKGAANQVLRVPSGGGQPAYGQLNLDSSAALTGTLGASNGGTNKDMSADSGVVKVATGTFSAASVVNADVDNAAAIARSKLATGTNYRLLANNATGVMSENAALTSGHSVYVDANGQLVGEAVVASTRGGTGVNNAGTLTIGSNNITFTTSGATSCTLPTSGTLATLAGTETFSNKTEVSKVSQVIAHSARLTAATDAVMQTHGQLMDQATFWQWSNDANPVGIEAIKSRGGVATNTIPSANDYILRIRGSIADGGDYNNPAAEITFRAGSTPSNGTDSPGYMEFRTTPDGTGTLQTRMTISDTGRIGVAGSVTSDTAMTINGDNRMLYLLNGSTTAAYHYIANNNGSGGTVYFGVDRSAGGILGTGCTGYSFCIVNGTNFDLQLGTNNTVRLTVENDGEVGIGTTDPTYKLQVVGSVKGTGFNEARVHKTANYTMTATDDFSSGDATGGAFTFTLPDSAAAADGKTYTIIKMDSSTNAITIDGDGADTINGATTVKLTTQYDTMKLIADGSNAWYIVDHTAPSKWNSYTPTGSWSSNTTYTGFWKRVGDAAHYQIRVATSGDPNAAGLTVNLPSGHTIDTAKMLDASVDIPMGICTVINSGVGTVIGQVGYSSTTAVALNSPANGAGTTDNRLSQISDTGTIPAEWGANDYVSCTFGPLPIVDWAS